MCCSYRYQKLLILLMIIHLPPLLVLMFPFVLLLREYLCLSATMPCRSGCSPVWCCRGGPSLSHSISVSVSEAPSGLCLWGVAFLSVSAAPPGAEPPSPPHPFLSLAAAFPAHWLGALSLVIYGFPTPLPLLFPG